MSISGVSVSFELVGMSKSGFIDIFNVDDVIVEPGVIVICGWTLQKLFLLVINRDKKQFKVRLDDQTQHE